MRNHIEFSKSKDPPTEDKVIDIAENKKEIENKDRNHGQKFVYVDNVLQSYTTSKYIKINRE